MRALAIAGTGAAAAAIAWSAPALAPLVPSFCGALGIARRLDDGARHAALTFDDGPHAEGTPAVLDALERSGARATFFLVGEQVERRPALAAEIVAAGHAIASHGYLHRNQLRRTPRSLAADIDRGGDVIERATGVKPSLYRPPYGIFSAVGLAAVRARGLEPLLWSRWGRDWRARIKPETIAAKVTDGVEAADVLLLHDSDTYSAEGSWRRTVAALPQVLDQLGRRGLLLRSA